MSDDALEAGQPRLDLDGYRIVRPLGDDGAKTFLAHDTLLDRAVVVTRLEGADPEMRILPARALARVTHPNLCNVHGVREERAVTYVISEYARGVRLDRLGAPLPADSLLAVGRAVARALVTLHAVGVVHGDVRPGRIVYEPEGRARLFGISRARYRNDAVARGEDVDALVSLLGDLGGASFRREIDARAPSPRTAEQLALALDALTEARTSRRHDNPYPGLSAFDADTAPCFFGRDAEISELVDRLSAQPILVVAGRSGIGKSSLVRAGLGPAIAAGAMGEREAWDVIAFPPGSSPRQELALHLGPVLGREPSELAARLAEDPALAERLSARRDRGLLIVVDPLEELFTLAGDAERAAFLAILRSFQTIQPGVRLVLTLRSDFLHRLAELGEAGRALLAWSYVCPAMTAAGLREAILAPARARGFDFEAPERIDALVAEVVDRPETLPLLSFALHEVWGARDASRRLLPNAALDGIRGASESLARQGDFVLATLGDDARRAARRILVSLFTEDRSRSRCTRKELDAEAGPGRTALDALVRGRLVVADESRYEIVHETLLDAWPALEGFWDEASARRVAARQLAAAARDWHEAGRPLDGLWGRGRLGELDREPADPLVRTFLEASRARARATRIRRGLLLIGASALVGVASLTGWRLVVIRHERILDRAMAAARDEARQGSEAATLATNARASAVAAFERDDARAGELAWQVYLTREADADRHRTRAEQQLDSALALDPWWVAARALYADLLVDRLDAAEAHHQTALARALEGQLSAYDDGSRAASRGAPGHVVVTSEPRAAVLTLLRYVEDGRAARVESPLGALRQGESRALEPGSYVVVASAPSRWTTRSPFVVRRGEARELAVDLPALSDVPEGMVYVPAGTFSYGSADEEATRAFFTHQPAHAVTLPPFLIARREVTNGQYLAFLRALPAEARKDRTPPTLAFADDGHAVLVLRESRTREGEPYCKTDRGCVDWSDLPVAAASRDDGHVYARWLDETGRVVGARLCSDREWERSARGADDRTFPFGDRPPDPDEACTRAAYGGSLERAGPCASGSHPRSTSPFGVEDMVGSEWEWTDGSPDVAAPTMAAVRGGSWAEFGIYLAIANRGLAPVNARYDIYGLRVCASPKAPPKNP